MSVLGNKGTIWVYDVRCLIDLIGTMQYFILNQKQSII
jgi:hypothetical protein